MVARPVAVCVVVFSFGLATTAVVTRAQSAASLESIPISRPGAPARVVERWASIPPVGAKGTRVPLQTFEELLLGIGSDGSRAHHLAAPCSMP